jgi:hypothetical protein
MRKVALAHVVAKFQAEGDSYYLLYRHRKWGDWSLVGGHVEPGEEGLWVRTAVRETEEELRPLHNRRDFILVPLLSKPLTWGPLRSRSAAGELTLYTAQFFRMVFRRNPLQLLSSSVGSDIVLVRGEELVAHEKVAETVRILDSALRGGLEEIPPAWECAPEDEEAVRRMSTVREPRFSADSVLACG